jgi:hypothetical protein
VPRRLRSHGDELTSTHGDLLVVDDDGAGAVHDGIYVLGSVVDMVVSHGFRARRKLNLVDPESANAEACPTPLSYGLAAGCGPGVGFISAASALV